MSLNPLVIIPARMGSTRLPDKPLAMIGLKPMIVHVVERALEADIGPVLVATDDERIVAALGTCNVRTVMTKEDHQSGSDRIYEALQKIDPDGHFNVIINLQGDLPTIAPHAIHSATTPFSEDSVDIATLCAPINSQEEALNPNVVKLIGTSIAPNRLRALYFTRARAPYGEGVLYHHIGLYAYRRCALERFITLPPSPLELREKLEQLRALEAGMRIDAEIVDDVPLGVDTREDLIRACQILNYSERDAENRQD